MSRFFLFCMTVVVMILSVLALRVTLSYATHDPNVIHACVGKITGIVRVVSNPSKCRLAFENPLDLQKAGAGNGDTCPDDMVAVGDICVDKYEASAWDSPDGSGTQFGESSDDYPCSDNGNDCSDSAANPIYALSLPGVTPSARITWFQAQQACFNVGKRLLTNAEWQGAAAGTPDPGTDNDTTDCNISFDAGSDPVASGSRSDCVSNWGASDMVGNVAEWVADWIQNNSDSPGDDVSDALYGGDEIAGIDDAAPVTDEFPAALFRGGAYPNTTFAGVFALDATSAPSVQAGVIGFRCARNR